MVGEAGTGGKQKHDLKGGAWRAHQPVPRRRPARAIFIVVCFVVCEAANNPVTKDLLLKKKNQEAWRSMAPAAC
jgi:hypothetical protein